MSLIKLTNLFPIEGVEDESEVQGEAEINKTANKEFKNKTIMMNSQ